LKKELDADPMFGDASKSVVSGSEQQKDAEQQSMIAAAATAAAAGGSTGSAAAAAAAADGVQLHGSAGDSVVSGLDLEGQAQKLQGAQRASR
jgi:hypothetical protein